MDLTVFKEMFCRLFGHKWESGIFPFRKICDRCGLIHILARPGR